MSAPADELAAFRAALPRGRPVLGLDLGEKTIGLALSDRGLTIATPQGTIRRRRFGADAAALLAFAAAREAGGLVFGLPRNMDGSEGPRAQSTRAFARNLARLTDLPMAFWDERLSTVAATRALLEADASRARRRELVDQVAAGYILQGFLDRLAHLRRAEDGGDGAAPGGPAGTEGGRDGDAGEGGGGDGGGGGGGGDGGE